MPLLWENEKKIKEIRRHPFYFYCQSAGIFIFAIMPIIFALAIFVFVPIDGFSLHTIVFVCFFYLLFLLFLWIYLFISWTDYFVDVWILTDSRVLDFELKGLFHRDVASVRFENIQDVKVEVRGFIEHWLKIGDLHLQTAGVDKEFVIRGVREPSEMKLKIMEEVHKIKTAHFLDSKS